MVQPSYFRDKEMEVRMRSSSLLCPVNWRLEELVYLFAVCLDLCVSAIQNVHNSIDFRRT